MQIVRQQVAYDTISVSIRKFEFNCGQASDRHWFVSLFVKPFHFESDSLSNENNFSNSMSANSTYNSIFLTNTEIKNEAAVLLLGKSYSGCILHGPGLIFNTTGMNPQSAVFGPCPLRTGSCDQRDVLVRAPVDPVDHCLHDPCMQHGSCKSRADKYVVELCILIYSL